MKKLFLASVARNTIDKFIATLTQHPSKLTVGFVPTAGNISKDNSFVVEDRKSLTNKGFNVIDIELENKTEKQLSQEIKNIDIIFVAGGNTFYLLQETIKSGFNNIITTFIKNGGMYIGSSAGSLLASPSIELAIDIDDQTKAPDLKSYDSLALVNFVPLPHYNDPYFKDKINQNLKKHPKYKYKTIKISDQQAILVEGNQYKIVSN